MKLIVLSTCILLWGCNNPHKLPEIVFPEGGYDLPKHVDDKDSNFFCYPIKHIESANDSFHDAFYGHLLLSAFNEPNISTTSFDTPVFRFIFQCWTCPTIVITLTPTKIIVKKGDRVDYVKRADSLLSGLENYHLEILEWNFPIIKSNTEIRQPRQRYLDSLINLYPKLTDPDYFNHLLNKVFIPSKTPFTYSTTNIPISFNQYAKIIDKLNESGYWEMPFNLPCNNSPMDAAGFTLEANTQTKYNIVKFGACGDGEFETFKKACRELVKLANIDIKMGL
ncbi:MAG: hypothetical protein ABJB11_17250 [Ferruginibacter sp.]